MKKIIGMYFGTKSYLKSNRKHTAKYVLKSQHMKVTIQNKIISFSCEILSGAGA